MTLCYIGLGANLNNPAEQIVTALQALDKMPHCRLTAWSSLYGSKPLGPQDQPDYMNAVAALETELQPEALLDALKQQEDNQGRVKLRHWGERTIDLDILLYGDQVYQSDRLTIPHREMCNRSFVVLPLLEIAPQLILPDGRKLAALEPEFSGEIQRISVLMVDL
ncbi:MAG: 2-amino-4-hydroxy-6-hydroxymethyldihydropteridine diphosphokinase [Oceanospirillaceae bacterium]|nr:2-amino-4-hydroxy-6-hydroxymethyldihydropteridine diphosphokinase [Oceanospirillaceae bacterium]MBT10816.1 2-amino-4-hydroxy-6-hydroxymethyldihydropteridine diphosphokinase [Oceanospirillaceae bacterium]|tara:strand:- start:29824 stop:30318 length:495 start_codon:yes stop_codon:yes gene_type:complete